MLAHAGLSATVWSVSTTETETIEDIADGAVGMRTPLYPLISLVGVFIVICAFLPWAGVRIDTDGEIVGGPTSGFARTKHILWDRP